MEIEHERSDYPAEKTDDGYSEEKLAKQFDLGKSSRHTITQANIFTPQKKTQTGQTVFQAQKQEKK